MGKRRSARNKRGGAGFWDTLTGKDAQYTQCKQSCDDQLKARKSGRVAPVTGGIMGSMGLTGAAPGGMMGSMGMGSAAPSYSTSGYGSSGYGNPGVTNYGSAAASYRPQQSPYSSGYYGGRRKSGKRKSCRGSSRHRGRRTRRR